MKETEEFDKECPACIGMGMDLSIDIALTKTKSHCTFCKKGKVTSSQYNGYINNIVLHYENESTY